MSNYFTYDPDRKLNRKKISFRFLGNEETLISDDGVFSKSTLDFGSRVLLETVVGLPLNGKLLDLGCGLGYMGIMLKKYHPELDVTMADINQLAVMLAEENSRLYSQNNRVLLSDGFSNIADSFDIVITNPPIRTGKENIYRLFRESLDHLMPEGSMYIVIRRQQGAESAVRYLNQMADTEIINREKGYWIIKVSRPHPEDGI